MHYIRGEIEECIEVLRASEVDCHFERKWCGKGGQKIQVINWARDTFNNK